MATLHPNKKPFPKRKPPNKEKKKQSQNRNTKREKEKKLLRSRLSRLSSSSPSRRLIAHAVAATAAESGRAHALARTVPFVFLSAPLVIAILVM